MTVEELAAILGPTIVRTGKRPADGADFTWVAVKDNPSKPTRTTGWMKISADPNDVSLFESVDPHGRPVKLSPTKPVGGFTTFIEKSVPTGDKG